jgi:hypothetical protein
MVRLAGFWFASTLDEVPSAVVRRPIFRLRCQLLVWGGFFAREKGSKVERRMPCVGFCFVRDVPLRAWQRRRTTDGRGLEKSRGSLRARSRKLEDIICVIVSGEVNYHPKKQ